jgi:SAM-dependent methyltransferase
MDMVSYSPEHDRFWETIAPFLFTPDRLAAAATEVEQICTLLHVSPPAALLDLCCGVGRHALAFARRGFTVTGVDRTAAYLAHATAQAIADGLSVEWLQAEMATFRRPATFDVVVNLFTSFGYFEDLQQDRQVVQHVYEALRPGGVFLLDVAGKETLARQFRPRDWQAVGDTVVVEERTITQHWGWIANRWLLFRGTEPIELRFGHRLYAATELVGLLQACGFGTLEVYGDLLGHAYDHEARRLVVVARK